MLEKVRVFLPLTTRSLPSKQASCAGNSTFHAPFSHAVVVAEAPLKETVTSSLGSAHPQTEIGFSRWKTPLSVKHLGSETSANAEDVKEDATIAEARSVNKVFFIENTLGLKLGGLTNKRQILFALFVVSYKYAYETLIIILAN